MKIKNKSVIINDLGVVDYKECWDFQEKLFKNVVDVKIKNRREALNKPTSNYQDNANISLLIYILTIYMFKLSIFVE